MDVAALQARARKARDQISKEKHELATHAWMAAEGAAADKIHQRIVTAGEQLAKKTVSAADQGKDEVILLRLSLQKCDLRQIVQAQLHKTQAVQPDPYPGLRALGPPSFRDIEKWLSQDVGLKDLEGQCPLPWLVALDGWVRGQQQAGLIKRWLNKRPPLPEALEQLFESCQRQGFKPRFEPYKQFEDEGVALVVRWK